MSQAFSEKRSSGEYRKPKKGLADEIAADPTSVFLSALRHSHPDALKALAVWCKKQESQENQNDHTKPAKKHDQTSVIQAMEGLKRVGSATASRLSAVKKEDENLIELESLTTPAHVSASLDETADYPTIAYAHMETSAARELIEEKAQAAAAAYSASLDETSEYAAIPFSSKDFSMFAGDPLPEAIDAFVAEKQEEKRKLLEAQEKLQADKELLEVKQHRLEELEKLEARKKAEEDARKKEDLEFEEKRQLEAKKKLIEEERTLEEARAEEVRVKAEKEQADLEEKRRFEQKQKKLEEKQRLEEEKRIQSKIKLESETPEQRKKREEKERLEAKKKKQEREELEARNKLEELERIQARQRIEEQKRLEILKKQEEQEKLEARKLRDERERLELERKQKEKEEREKLEAEKLAQEQMQLAAKKQAEEELKTAQTLKEKESVRLENEADNQKSGQRKKLTGEIELTPEVIVQPDFSLPGDEAIGLFGADRLLESSDPASSEVGTLDFSVAEEKSDDRAQNEISSSQPSIKPEILAAFDIPIPKDEVENTHAPVDESGGPKTSIPLRSVAKGPAKPQRIEPGSKNTQQNIDAVPKPINTEGFLEEELQEEYQGVYEQVTARGGVFDAKSRDSFSGNSEKKIRTTYIGLKAISREEAEAAQEDVVQKQKKTQEVRALLTPDAPIGEKLNTAAQTVKKVNKAPFIIAASVLVIAGLALVVTNLGRGENSLKDGEKLFAEKKYEAAAQAFSQAVDLNPVSAHSYFMRARAYNKLGDTNNALADFSSCLKINSTYAEALDHRASLYIRLGKYDDALSDYKTLFGSSTEPPKLYQLNNAALACRQLQKFEEASVYYDKALKLEPKDKDALLGRALCDTGLKQYAKAIEQCEKIIAIYPDDIEIYVTRGWCYVQLKQNAAAMKDFNYALQKEPHNAKAALNRGHLYNQMGKPELAIRDYDVASKADPSLVEARSARAWALMHSKPGVALNDLKVVTESSQFKESADFWKARAELEMSAKKYSVSAVSFEKAIALSKTPNAVLNVGAAKAYNALKKYDKAVEFCNEAIAIEPNNAMAYAVRGYAHDGAKNAISAVSDYAQAIQLNSKMPEAYLFRAQHYIREKKYLAAQTDLKDVLALNANHADAKKLLAAVESKIPRSSASYPEREKAPDRRYAKVPFDQLVSNGYAELNKGKTETAAAMLTEAVRQNPSDFQARRYLCHALMRENPTECVRQIDSLRSSGQLNADDEHCYSVALSFAATGGSGETNTIKKAVATLARSPGNSEACYKMAMLYFAARMPSKAQAFLQQGIGGVTSKAEGQRFQELNEKISKQGTQTEMREDIGG